MQRFAIKVFLPVIICAIFFMAFFAYADTTSTSTDDISQKIEDHKNIILQLEQEAKKYQQEIDKTSAEKVTLQSTIKTLDTTKKKIDTDIKITQTNISKTTLNIQTIGTNIETTKQKIEHNKESISKNIRAVYEMDSQSLIETMLANNDMNDVWNHMQALTTLNGRLQDNVHEFLGLTKELEANKNETEIKKNELESQKVLLSSQKQSVEATKEEKAQVLQITKNKEENFKKLLADKLAQKEAFEKELFDFEQQLKINVDTGSFPSSGFGIFSWPLVKHTITQLFGKTVSAKRLYTSGTHNGVDFGTPRGTPVKAVLNGTVTATGNTDSQPGCYSYGKWILLKHPNGLSTIYGHLSVISVSSGASVHTGDIIGLSGNTGYSTGPHLHLGVFATQGMRVEQYVNSNYCKNVTIPIADTKAYLDPMVYLPK